MPRAIARLHGVVAGVARFPSTGARRVRRDPDIGTCGCLPYTARRWSRRQLRHPRTRRSRPHRLESELHDERCAASWPSEFVLVATLRNVPAGTYLVPPTRGCVPAGRLRTHPATALRRLATVTEVGHCHRSCLTRHQ